MTVTLSTLIDQYKSNRDELPDGHPERAQYDELIANARRILREFQQARRVEAEHAAD